MEVVLYNGVQYIVKREHYSLLYASNHGSRGTSRQQSEDLIYNQIDAFERLLQHSMSRFSKENLYHMLTHVTKWAEADRKTKIDNKIAFKLKSVGQLRKIVESVKQKNKVRNPEDEIIFKQYELFLSDLLYLRDLKKYFDDEIHKKLQKYHSDPNAINPTQHDDVRFEDVENTELFIKHTGGFKTERSEDHDSGRGSQPDVFESKHDAQSATGNNKLQCQGRFIQTVKDLEVLLRKWQGLLTEDTLELNDFDPDSYHELMQFSRYSQFEPLLRLVPDIFAKCYKCIDLSKRWLEDSKVILKDLPVTSTPIPDTHTLTPSPDGVGHTSIPDIDRKLLSGGLKTPARNQNDDIEQIRDLERQIRAVNTTIEDSETQLIRYNDDMNALVGRDERFASVSSEFNKLDSLITIAAGDYQKSKTEQYALASKLRNCRKESPTYTELKSHLKRLDTEVSQNHWRMKLLEFEKSTVQEDYLVEMEVRPSFIRFVGDTKDKMQELETVLQARKEEKLRLEKQLALTKTNTNRTRQILGSQLRTASSIGGGLERSMTYDSLPQSPNSDVDDSRLPVSGQADGNEADDDSSGQSARRPNGGNRGKTASPPDDVIMKTPRLVQNKQTTKRDLRPFSEGNTQQPRVRAEPNSPSQRTACSRGPRAALKSQPKRVWEFA